MARKPKTQTVYEKIDQTESEIASAKRKLEYLKSQLEILYAEKDEFEMREVWQAIKEKGMSMEDVQKLLNQLSKHE